MISTHSLVFLAFALSAPLAGAAVVFTESFGYPDGVLVNAVGTQWSNHSGTVGQVNVLGGTVEITFAEAEDVNALLAPTGSFYNSGTLTATATVNFSALPTSAGGYFLHYKDGASGFRGRVFATTLGAAAGTFRLGIANTTADYQVVPGDLSIGTNYTLTLAMNAATGSSTLSIGGIGTAAASDATTPISVTSIALRQSGGIGTLTLDNVSVDATLAAVPEGSSFLMTSMAGLVLLNRRRRTVGISAAPV